MSLKNLSIITPWVNASVLIDCYERSVQGAQVIVIDNGSDVPHRGNIARMVKRLGGIYIRNDENMLFAHANNQGLEVATGDVIMFLNNDIEAQPGFVEQVLADVKPDGLYGPSMMAQTINDHLLPYIEGWCIAAYREVWDTVGAWNTKDYQGLYWEDNDLCFRAGMAGYKLIRTDWKIDHYGNYTSRHIAGAYDYSKENRDRFSQEVLDKLGQRRQPA